MRFMKFVLLGIFLSSVTACTQNPEWTLFYYADSNQIPENAELNEHISGYYSNADQCLLKGSGMVRLSDSGVGSYQCGQRCVANDTGGLTCQSFVDKLVK